MTLPTKDSKKHIAFIIYKLSAGGAERVVCSLANALVGDYQVSIITTVSGISFYRLDNRINVYSCSHKIITKTNFLKSTINALIRVYDLYRIFKKHKIDLSIGFMTQNNINTIWASRLAKIPSIVSERTNHVDNPLPKITSKIRNISYRLSNLLVVQTKANKQYYAKTLSQEKISVIQNPISLDLQNKRDPNKKNESKIILNVGRLVSSKAQDLLIKAFVAVNNPEWKLLFAGDGPKKNEYLGLAKSVKLSNNIFFLGNISDITSYYNKASIFAFTSEYEGFPNALAEALYFGIPSISTDCRYGPADLIDDGTNGFLIPVGSQEQLTARLSILMEDSDLRRKFSNNATVSTKKLEMTFIVKQWKDEINKLI